MPSTPYTSEATLAETNSKFTDRVALLASADEALAGRTQTLESTVNTPVTGLTARIANEETTRANADAALANRTTTIESRTTNTLPNLLVNGDFKDGQYYWAASGPVGIGYASSIGSYVNLPGANSLFIYNDVRVDPGQRYSISAEGHGHNCNAFIYGQFINEPRNTVMGTTPTINLTAGNYARRGNTETICPTGAAWLRVIAQKDASGADGYLNVTRIAVQNGVWTYWRDDASIRDTTARITSEETTRSTADNALANRALALESTVNTPGTGLLARITSEETTRASQTSALASRTNTLEAKVTNGRSNLQTNGGFEKQLDGVSNPRGENISIDVNNPYWGTYLGHSYNNTSAIYMPGVRVVQNTTYTVSFDSAIFAAGGSVRVDVATYPTGDGSGNEIGNAGGSGLKYANTDFRDNARDEFQFTVPNGVNSIRLRLIGENVSGAQLLGFRRIKVERGSLPSTPFTTEATDESIYARIKDVDVARANQTQAVATRTTSLETRAGNLESSVSVQSGSISSLNNSNQDRINNINDLYSRNAAWFVVDAVAGNNRAQLRVVASANGGAGVDITGDLSVSGNVIVGGTITTGKMAGNAINKGYYNELSDVIGLPNAQTTTIFQQYVVKDEPDSALEFRAVLIFSSSDDIRGTLFLDSDNGTGAVRQIWLNGAGKSLQLSVPFQMRTTNAPAGGSNYYLRFYRQGGGANVVVLTGSSLIIEETKR